jgi:hypothetical protein
MDLSGTPSGRSRRIPSRGIDLPSKGKKQKIKTVFIYTAKKIFI